MQCLSSIVYQSTLSDITFKDSANGSVDKDHSGETRVVRPNYAVMGPSESNDSVFQGAAEEPVAEGAISRPTSQASIPSNEVTSKLTYGKVHPAW